MKTYLPEEVPNNLFTLNKLKLMGLTPTAEHVALVSYPEQRREYKLYDIKETRKPKKQNREGVITLTRTDATLEEILKEREWEMRVRKSQLRNKE
jgi:hypothetical protein